MIRANCRHCLVTRELVKCHLQTVSMVWWVVWWVVWWGALQVAWLAEWSEESLVEQLAGQSVE
jgi:hypothetical protein